MTVVPQVDLRASLGPVRDQGSRPTCLAFASSDTHTFERKDKEPLSVEYLFFHAQMRAKRTAAQGALFSQMLNALQFDGQPLEDSWPYLIASPTNGDTWKPPNSAVEIYKRNHTVGQSSVEWIISELNKGHAVLVLTTISASFYRPNLLGIVDPGIGETPDPTRRHAVVCVGHGNFSGQRMLLIRNSWGSGWALEGHAWLSENYATPRIFRAAILTGVPDVHTDTAAS